MTTKRSVAFVVSNQATSSVTGWPISCWLAELVAGQHQHSGAEAARTLIEALR